MQTVQAHIRPVLRSVRSVLNPLFVHASHQFRYLEQLSRCENIRESKVDGKEEDRDKIFDLLCQRGTNILRNDQTDEESSEDRVTVSKRTFDQSESPGVPARGETHIPSLSVNQALASTAKITETVIV